MNYAVKTVRKAIISSCLKYGVHIMYLYSRRSIIYTSSFVFHYVTRWQLASGYSVYH